MNRASVRARSVGLNGCGTARSWRERRQPAAPLRRVVVGVLAMVACLVALCLLVATAGLATSSDSSSRASLALVVGWSVCLVLTWCAAIALCLRWRLTGDAATGWVVVAALCGAVYLTSCALRLYVAMPAGAGLSTYGGVDVLMIAVWLVLVRCAVTRPDSLPRSGPIWLGSVLGLIGAAVQTTMLSLDDIGTSPALGWVARVVVVALGTIGVVMLWRTRHLGDALRWQLMVVCALGSLSRVLSETDPVRPSVEQALSLLCALGAATVLCRVGVNLLIGARAEGEAARALAKVALDDATASEQLHELRASFAGLSSAIHLLSEHAGEIGRSRSADVVTMLAEEVDRLERLLAGHPAHAADDVGLDAVLEPVVTARRLAGQRVEWDPSGCRVVGSPDLIATAVNMLLVNAGVHAPGSRVRLSAVEEGRAIRVRVTDDGPGIPASVRARLFTRGGQARGSPGQGIGLQFAARLAAAQGGSLELSDARAGGTTFVMTLPRTSGTPDTHTMHTGQEGPL